MKKEFKSLTEELNRIKELSGVKLVKENKISKNDLITALQKAGIEVTDDMKVEIQEPAGDTKIVTVNSDGNISMNEASVKDTLIKAICVVSVLGAVSCSKPSNSDMQGLENGYWVGPTLLDNVQPHFPAGCDEIFGPVLSIIRVKTLEEALKIENSNAYGNAASIFTTNGANAHYLTRNANAGMNGINVGVPVPREPFGFGGWNDSRFGHGDITGDQGVDFWTQDRKITTKFVEPQTRNWMS